MQRLSDVMSNVNLTLHRRLVPAGKVNVYMVFHKECTYGNKLHFFKSSSMEKLLFLVMNEWCGIRVFLVEPSLMLSFLWMLKVLH